MQQNKIESVDRGWESMHKILDQEMPLKNKKRRLFLYWLTGGFALVLLIAFIGFFNSDRSITHPSSDITINNSNASNLSEENNIKDVSAAPAGQNSNDKTTDDSPNKNKTVSQEQLTSTNPKPTKESTNTATKNLETSNTQSVVTANNNSNSQSTTIEENEKINVQAHDESAISPTDAVQQSPQIESPSISKASLPEATTTVQNEVGETLKNKDITSTPTQQSPPSIAAKQTGEPTESNVSNAVPQDDLTPQVVTDVIEENATAPATKLESEMMIVNKAIEVDKSKLDSATIPEDVAKTKKTSSTIGQGTGVAESQQKNTILTIASLPTLLTVLDLPATQVLAMSLPLSAPNPVVVKTPEYALQHHWELGLQGLFAHNATGIGLELMGGYRRELTKKLSAHLYIGGGLTDITNTASLGELDDLADQTAGIDRAPNDMEPAGDTADPAGPAGAAPQGGGAGAPEEIDVGMDFTPEIPELELTVAQLRSLSLSNISSLNFLTAKTGIQLAATRRFNLGGSFGLDYILNTRFNSVFISEDQFLTLDASSSGLTSVELEEGNDLLTYVEGNTTYKVSERLSVQAGYKQYLKAIFPALGKNWLNQIRLGLFLNLRGKNKE